MLAGTRNKTLGAAAVGAGAAFAATRWRASRAIASTAAAVADDPLPPPGHRTTTRHPNPRQPSAVLCSLATKRHRELLAQSAPTIHAYAARHGWDVVISSEELEPDRPPSWSKLKLIRELLGSYEFVFWVDADAIIVDLDRDVLAETSEDADIWFARHPQERNPDASVWNAGIILARSSPFAFGLIDAMWASEQHIDHNWWENAALLDVLGFSLEPPFAQHTVTHWNARVGELDLAWNSVPGYCESPTPALNHHARSDHDSFSLRLASLEADRLATLRRPRQRSPRRSRSST